MTLHGTSELKLNPWRKSGLLTSTRTVGQIALRKNGTGIDIWIRIDGKPQWFAVDRANLINFLFSDTSDVILHAQSDGNTEESQ